MAPPTSRPLLTLTSQALRQCRPCRTLAAVAAAGPNPPQMASPAPSQRQHRSFSSTPAARSEAPPQAEPELHPSSHTPAAQPPAEEAPPPGPYAHATAKNAARPRWSYTPEQMKGPGFSINIVKDPRRTIWSVNDDPKKVDAFYINFLGSNGDKMLSDETKWLALTHKSFDQGRRGFNTRLAYYGRQIIVLEATRYILVNPAIKLLPPPDPFNRKPFKHVALATVDKLSMRVPQQVIHPDKVGRLALELNLPEVMRWKPRMPENLEQSGIMIVMNTTMYAIIGALALENGAEVASRVVREKVLRRLEK